jgi:hypothetical protein
MDKAGLAEWILGCICGKQRASEIIGDLLEQESPSSIGFWWTVFLVLLALIWRWVAGIVAAAAFPFFGMVAYATFVASKVPVPLDNHAWSAWAFRIMIAGACAWSVVALNAFRFGVQEDLTKVGASWAIVLTAVGCSIRLPFAQFVCPMVMLACIALCLLHRSFRRPFLCILSAAGSYAGMFALLVSLLSRPSTVSARVLIIELFGCWFASIVFEAWVLARTRRLLLSGS